MPKKLRQETPEIDSAERIHPNADRVLVTEDAAPDTYGESGLYIPESHQDKHQPTQGTILALGPQVEADVEVGDRVVYGRFDGTAIETEDEGKVMLIMGSHLMAIIEED